MICVAYQLHHMSADDLVLLSASVCELQTMLGLCADSSSEIGMQINSKKCAILRFGPHYANPVIHVLPCGFGILLLIFVIGLIIQVFSCRLVYRSQSI